MRKKRIFFLILCNIHKFGQGSKFRKLIIKMIWIVLLFQVRRLSPRHLAQTYHHSLQHFHSKTRFFIKKNKWQFLIFFRRHIHLERFIFYENYDTCVCHTQWILYFFGRRSEWMDGLNYEHHNVRLNEMNMKCLIRKCKQISLVML